MMQKQKHLLWRAGFGPDSRSPVSELNQSVNQLIEKLFQHSGSGPLKLKGVEGDLSNITGASGSFNDLPKETRMQVRNLSKEGFRTLNILWLNEMAESKAQLREKMALFWHGHFACRINNIFFAQDLLHIIRTNALGKFGVLLSEVSKSPAMLSFLNNQQNRKRHPNENFSRELLELFTLGRGQYKEEDVKEAARAFTGWGFDKSGNFIFRPALHDVGEKNFMGRKGNFDGNDIINIILGNKDTANWITKKIVYFLLGTNIDKKTLAKLADDFFRSELDISVLLRNIFTADWFYQAKYLEAKIKSPVEWISGIRRTLPIDKSKFEWQLVMQKLLGQVLFFPPNVAGWPGGTNWIDSSTLMYRLRWPLALENKSIFDGTPKPDDDIEMGKKNEGRQLLNRITAEVNWNEYFSIFHSVPQNERLNYALHNILVEDSFDTSILKEYVGDVSTDQHLMALTIHLMSTPEYQVC